MVTVTVRGPHPTYQYGLHVHFFCYSPYQFFTSPKKGTISIGKWQQLISGDMLVLGRGTPQFKGGDDGWFLLVPSGELFKAKDDKGIQIECMWSQHFEPHISGYELTMVIIQWSHEKGPLFLGVGWHWRGVPLDVHEFWTWLFRACRGFYDLVIWGS